MSIKSSLIKKYNKLSWNDTILGNFCNIVDFSIIFNLLVPNFIRKIWFPIPEIWSVCVAWFCGVVIYYGIIIGGETQSFLNKKYSADLALILSFDITFETQYGEKYAKYFYPNVPTTSMYLDDLE